MSRKPRSLVLFDVCTTNKVWRAHNKEYYLKDNSVKELYINSLKRTQRISENWSIIKEDTIKTYFKKQRDEKKNST